MTTRETAPAILEDKCGGLGADRDGDQVVRRGAWFGQAACYQIGTRAPYGILDDVREKRGKEYTDEQSQDRDVCLVHARPCYNSPNNQNDQWCYETNQDICPGRYALDESMWILSCAVVKSEHLVDRLEEEVYLYVLSDATRLLDQNSRQLMQQ